MFEDKFKTYDDPDLAAVVRTIVFCSPWSRIPLLSDFDGVGSQTIAPRVDWMIEYREQTMRDNLIAYMRNTYMVDIKDRVQALPYSYMTMMVASILYDTKVDADYLIAPRNDNEFCTSIYALPVYWLCYYFLEMESKQYQEQKTAEEKYRFNKLHRLRLICGAVIKSILAANPTLSLGNKVIVNATTSDVERITIWVDEGRFERYLATGGTVKKLAAEWVQNKTNPTIA